MADQRAIAVMPMTLATKYVRILDADGTPRECFHWHAIRDGKAPISLADARRELLKWDVFDLGHGAPYAVVADLDTDEVLRLAIDERWARLRQ